MRGQFLKKPVLLFAIGMLYILNAKGQYRLGNETYQYFSIGGGAGIYQNKDHLLIPTRFDGVGVNLLAQYTLDRPRTYQQAKFELSVGGEQNRAGYHGIFLFHRLTYDFYYQLLNESRFYAGAGVSLGTHNHYDYGLDDGHLYWLTGYEINGNLMYILDRRHYRQWIATGGMVLAGLESRPEAESYVSNFKNNAFWKEVNSHFAFAAAGKIVKFSAGLQYQMDIANGLKYEFQFYDYPDPAQVTFLSHTLTYTRRLGTKHNYQ